MLDAFKEVETDRRVANLMRYGTVASVDLVGARATVQLDDDWVSAPLPWIAGRAGGTRRWSPPTVGEQVAVLSPSGDPAGGFILTGLSSDAFPAPSAADVELAVFADGAQEGYDPAAHTRTITLPAGGSIVLKAGAVTVTITSDGVVVDASQISLGTGALEKVARVGDRVDLSSGLILTGSDTVKAA